MMLKNGFKELKQWQIHMQRMWKTSSKKLLKLKKLQKSLSYQLSYAHSIVRDS